METIIEMRHITKVFPGIIANDDITLELRKGEIHALLGENGAGKSTLMSVLFGLYQPEAGEIFIRGDKVNIKNPNDANALGIGMVHQHFKLVDVFTVLDCIIMGHEPMKHGLIDRKKAREKVLELSEKYHLYVDPDAKIEDITVGMQQRVEILKMLYRDNDILIFDEPTAVLTPQEIDELMLIMKDLVKEGKSILFISHKLNEIMQVSDRVTVLRKGKYMGTIETKNTSIHELSRLMVGRDIDTKVEKKAIPVGEEILTVEGLSYVSKITRKQTLHDVSFSVKAGEIVCIAGIEGNGQSDLVYCITGIENPTSGKVILKGENVTKKSIRYRNNLGMAHIPEDRQKYGLILDYNLSMNLNSKKYFTKDYLNFGFLDYKKMDTHAQELIETFDIRSGNGKDTIVRSMSGGNQQKAIIAREIDTSSDLLVAVQTTRGLDVGAIESIHKMIVNERNKGKAILLISLELDEVMNLSDRILVIYNGSIVAETVPQNTTLTELGLYMTGAKKGERHEG